MMILQEEDAGNGTGEAEDRPYYEDGPNGRGSYACLRHLLRVLNVNRNNPSIPASASALTARLWLTTTG